MPTEPLALSTRLPDPAADTDYDAICSAVAATTRGRWFLAEFVRRARQNDTAQLLSAIARMEAMIVGERQQHAVQDANQQVRIELLEMARTIAQTRAEVAENRATPSALARLPGSADQNIATAAERLRQIAWTMRACGVDVPASDQIAQIAETILAAEAVHHFDDQRSAKLTEVLHYLEHRIERMLDSRLAAATKTRPASDPEPPGGNTDHDAAAAQPATPIDRPAMTDVRADIEPTSSPLANDAASAAATAADATNASADDDVSLTVSDGAPEQPSSPASPIASETVATDVGESVAAPDVPPIEPEPASVASAPTMAHLDGSHLPPSPAQGSSDAPDAAPEQAPAPPAISSESSSNESSGSESSGLDAHEGAAAPTAIAAAPTAPAPAHEADAITSQVNQDLDSLTLDSPADMMVADSAGSDHRAQQPTQPQIIADGNDDNDPADFLLEAQEQPIPAAAPATSVQPAAPGKAKPLTALAKIGTELRVAAIAPAARPHGPAPKATTAPKSAAPITDGPLAPLMAMSEEERIALFS